MSTRTTRLRIAAGGAAILTLGGIALAPARASKPNLVDAITGRYIVTLQDTVSDPRSVAARQTGLLGGTVDKVFTSALKGYSVALPGALVSSLLGDPMVKSVEPDARITLDATQVNPPYNLDRIDQPSLPLNGTYTYGLGGLGVRAYVIDTGVRRSHPEFMGRVTNGYNVFNGTSDTSDCHGHGTHVAGTLASSTYGVAKAATIVPVKTFGCADTTTLSAIIAGIDWATADHRPGQPAVANLSFGGGVSPALDRAITALSNDGVAVAVAAGNDGGNACSSSPGSVAQVLTVGATDSTDAMAGFSNGGPCVDLFAPGVRIVSTDGRSNGSAVLSGTSMASPQVAGALAIRMGVPGTSAQAAQNQVLARATPGVVRGTGGRCRLLLGCRPATAGNRLLLAG